jgi:uncharacterized protein YcsI (UPF0317 family)
MNGRSRNAEQARAWIRAGEWTKPTAGLAPGFVQANLVILPQAFASDFASYCGVNPQALPLIEITDPGSPVPTATAASADLRIDLPRYRVFRDGDLLEEPTDVMTLWHDDFVAFLIGCSFTFDALLSAHGIAVRHVELGLNVPMYVTNRMTTPVGSFSGPLVASMRPIQRLDAERVVELTSDLGGCHGAPIQVGAPAELGIDDVGSPQYGDAVPVEEDEIPAFWACGVTAQAAIERSRIPFAITHAPGHMFITDLRVEDL